MGSNTIRLYGEYTGYLITYSCDVYAYCVVLCIMYENRRRGFFMGRISYKFKHTYKDNQVTLHILKGPEVARRDHLKI